MTSYVEWYNRVSEAWKGKEMSERSPLIGSDGESVFMIGSESRIWKVWQGRSARFGPLNVSQIFVSELAWPTDFKGMTNAVLPLGLE